MRATKDHCSVLVFNPEEKYDYLATTVIKGLQKTCDSVFAVSTSNGATQNVEDGNVERVSKECDLIIVLWGKRPDFHRLPCGVFKGELLEKVNQWHKVVYVDGSEKTASGYFPISYKSAGRAFPQ